MMMPSDRLTSVGVPQPSFAIGPIRKVPCCGGKNVAQVADDPRRVGDHVLREHDAVDRPGAHALGQRVEPHRAVEAEQPADAEQREAEAELDAGAELGGDDDQQREARATRRASGW